MDRMRARCALFAAWGLLGVAAGGGALALALEGEVVPIVKPNLAGGDRVTVGSQYADFACRTLGGGEVRLSEVVGSKVVLLQFWGIRCAPCLEEMKFLSLLQDEYGSRGLQVFGVNVDRAGPDVIVAAMAGRNAAPRYPILLDPELQAARRYTKWLVPVTVLIDRQGTVVAIHTGYRAELDAVIKAEVEEILGRTPYVP